MTAAAKAMNATYPGDKPAPPMGTRRAEETKPALRGKAASFVCAVAVAAAFRPTACPAAVFPKPSDLPVLTSLPDPLVMLDGRKVNTRKMWLEERRPELIRLFEQYMYGRLPPEPAAVSAKLE